MSVTVKMDASSEAEFSRALQALADAAGTSAGEAMKQQGRLLATDFAYWTKPKGKSPHEGKRHREHIHTWLAQIYVEVPLAVSWLKHMAPKGISDRFVRRYKRREFTECERILNSYLTYRKWRVGPFDGGVLHKAHERTPRLRTVLVLTPGQKSAWKAYLRKVQSRSGFAKSGFAQAAEQLGGTRGIPAWARKNNGPGRGSITHSAKGATLTIENRVRHIAPALDRAGEKNAIKHRVKLMQKLTISIGERRMRKTSKHLK